MKNKFNITTNNFFFILGILLLPFDSIPVFPTIYRPVSAIFFVLYFIQNQIVTIKIRRLEGLFLLFALYSCSVSWYKGYFIYDDLGAFYRLVISYGISFITLSSSITFFRDLRNRCITNDDYIEKFFHLLKIAYIFPLFIGVVQILAMINIIPMNMRHMITAPFSDRLVSRVQLTSREASWAGRHLLLLLPVVSYSSITANYILKAIIVTLLVLTFSLESFVVFMIAIIMYSVSMYRRRTIKDLLGGVIVIAIIGIMIISIPYALEMLNMESSYYGERLMFLYNYNVIETFFRDESTFVRVAYPYIGLKTFQESWLVGLGGGYFYREFPRHIYQSFPFALKFSEVYRDVNYLTTPVTRNLYARVLAEMGIMGFAIAGYINYLVINKFKRGYFIKQTNKFKLAFMLCILYASLLQFDSILYIHLWVVLGFTYSITGKPQKPVI